MSMSLLSSEVFARAWSLADDLKDARVPDRLTGLRCRSLARPLSGQSYVLDEVVALTEQLRRQRPGLPV